MRWLVLVAGDLSQGDAQRTHPLEFCRHLSERNEVSLMVRSGMVPEGGFTVISSPFLRNRLFFRIGAMLHILRNQLGKGKYDVVYIRASACDVSPLLIAKAMRIPCVLEINGAYAEEAKMCIRTSPLRRKIGPTLRFLVHQVLGRMGYYLADNIVTVTEELRGFLTEKYNIPRAKIGVFTNGVNTELFFPRDRSEARRIVGLNENSHYIGFVGRLGPWQGVDVLIKGFYYALRRHPGINLVIVGDGLMRASLTRLTHELGIERQVIWVGQVDYNDVPLFIGAFDIGVGAFSATKRNMLTGLSPLKIYEYLACGRPVLAPNFRSLEFVRDKEVGLLFTPNDPEDLAARLGELLDMPEQDWHAMSRRARELAVSRFSWRVIVREIESWLQRSLDQTQVF